MLSQYFDHHLFDLSEWMSVKDSVSFPISTFFTQLWKTSRKPDISIGNQLSRWCTRLPSLFTWHILMSTLMHTVSYISHILPLHHTHISVLYMYFDICCSGCQVCRWEVQWQPQCWLRHSWLPSGEKICVFVLYACVSVHVPCRSVGFKSQSQVRNFIPLHLVRQ